MKRFAMTAILFSALHVLSACAADTTDGAEANEETTGTTTGPMKWKPLPGEWVPCDFNGMKCYCKGDVIDCREATGDGGTKAISSASTSLSTATTLLAP